MKNMSIILLLIPLLWTGCAHSPVPVRLCQASVHNGTAQHIRDFRIVHHPTERVLSSNRILAGSNLELGVPNPELKATSATLTWENPAEGFQTVDVQIPQTADSPRPKRLIYLIDTSGGVQVRLEPCD